MKATCYFRLNQSWFLSLYLGAEIALLKRGSNGARINVHTLTHPLTHVSASSCFQAPVSPLVYISSLLGYLPPSLPVTL